MSAVVVVEPTQCFGLKADVRDNICFVDEQTVVYPAGSSLIVYNIDTRTQRFIQVGLLDRSLARSQLTRLLP
jgi:hypothetical protein